MSGVPVDAGLRPRRRRASRVSIPYTRGPYAVDVPLEAVDDADVRGLRHRARHEPSLPRAARGRAATACRPRSTCPTLMGRDSDDELALGEVGKCGVAVDTLADMRGSLPRHRPRRGHDVDDDQRPGRGDLRDVRRERGGGRRRARPARRHAPERHPEGVPGAEGVHLPAPAVAAARAPTRCGSARPRCRAGIRSRSPATTSARPARPPPQELAFTVANGFAYVELGVAGRARRRRVRAAPVVLLQRAHRLLRGDRQVPRRAPHLGPLDARPLRRAARAVAADAVPHADRRACRSPRSSPRSTSCAPRSRRWPACSAARRACTPTRWTRRSRCRPSRRRASRCARSRCIAHETRVANVADPLGGSWYVEALTDELERRAEAIFARIDEHGRRLDARRRGPRRRGGLVPAARSPTPRTSSSAS